MNREETILRELFSTWSGEDAHFAVKLPESGSYRHYYRLKGPSKTAIGVFHEDLKENAAFISFTKHFTELGLPVPDILMEADDPGIYLISDLGDLTLFDFLTRARKDDTDFPPEVDNIYRKVIAWLPEIQVRGGKDIDYSVCYPRAAFDRQSMSWDLNYFKYYFLKLAKVPFDEQRLEDDFQTLTDFLLDADHSYFMYRDFQSRNIMIRDGEPWFIDYQGGRKGPLQYDIASLLYDAKAAIPQKVRNDMLASYLEVLENHIQFDRRDFLRHYYGFVLIRILQAMGAYGFRGYYEHKPHFLQSIPYATRNIRYLLDENLLTLHLPELYQVLEKIAANPAFSQPQIMTSNLAVEISSFSYREPLPEDPSGNGGGFVFDCRALPNPGKLDEYKALNGRDKPVIEFLAREHDVDEFLNHVYSIVSQSVKRYIEHDFTHLSVTFGCTGGQHRSVYCAEMLARHLEARFPVKVILNHTKLKKG
jgi:aminoglycoside/choline kinase family phosphotransferase